MENTLVDPKITVIQPQRSLNVANALEFERELVTALRQNYCSALLVDLERVEFIDSAGLIALMSGLKLARCLGKCLSLCSVSPQLKIIFEVSRLDTVFDIAEGDNKALLASL
ncbi:MAG: STAS domain-containing protein [Rhizonema sp. NSF051]|nr:STAS domain-containing protein [Rhizonema sp. NSF051]